MDNVTTMKRAREILLSLAPEVFALVLVVAITIQTTKEGAACRLAKTHHADRQINADLFLKKPP